MSEDTVGLSQQKGGTSTAQELTRERIETPSLKATSATPIRHGSVAIHHMSAQPTLLPTLLALHPAQSLPILLSRLSLQALHIEPYHIQDDIYTATTSVIPGQLRNLRLRAERTASKRNTAAAKGKGKAKAVLVDREDEYREYTLTYLSPPLSGREYSEMSVRACIGLEVGGMTGREGLEGFVEALGFRQTHSYSRSGYLIHLPLPLPSPTPLTIHLSITRLGIPPPVSKKNPDPDEPRPQQISSEPYLLILQPSRPVQAVSARGEPGLEDMMRVMRDVADRIEGVHWESGRP